MIRVCLSRYLSIFSQNRKSVAAAPGCCSELRPKTVAIYSLAQRGVDPALASTGPSPSAAWSVPSQGCPEAAASQTLSPLNGYHQAAGCSRFCEVPGQRFIFVSHKIVWTVLSWRGCFWRLNFYKRHDGLHEVSQRDCETPRQAGPRLSAPARRQVPIVSTAGKHRG